MHSHATHSGMDTSLKEFLMDQSPGSDLDREQVEFLLAEAWSSLRGSRTGGHAGAQDPGTYGGPGVEPAAAHFQDRAAWRHGERLDPCGDAALVCGCGGSHG